MYRAVRPLLFRLAPERAHAASLRAMQLVSASRALQALIRPLFQAPPCPVEAFGLRFQNPLGLAAGYDKDAVAVAGLATLGFGHLEVGTVTLRPQPGNAGPRVFRLPVDAAIVNRLGFPSRGADFVAAQLSRPRPPGLVVGVNIGKNKDTPLERAPEDYAALVDRFAPLADYLVINVSSPNTIGLRRLQGRAALEALLDAALASRDAQPRRTPLLVKLAPDLDDAGLDDALGVLLDRGVDGVVATNTTLSRAGLRSAGATAAGGLSGRPLTVRANALVAAIAERAGGKLPIIGVGGISTAEDVRARLDAGATLVQLYTSLVYEGPGVVQRIVRAL
jgi:dihydroorotate dehydrogenase